MGRVKREGGIWFGLCKFEMLIRHPSSMSNRELVYKSGTEGKVEFGDRNLAQLAKLPHR